jgi:hypothetical protein
MDAVTATALALLVATSSPPTAGLKYDRNPARWQEEPPPADTRSCPYELWSLAANYSDVEWRVSREGSELRAQLADEPPRRPAAQPSFAPHAGRFRQPSATRCVEDGWLVGFHQGELGGALYWFSDDGARSYKVSDHHVRDLFVWAGGVYAIQGLAHLGQSRGSIIEVSRPAADAPWQARTAIELPAAPYAVSQRGDGTLLVTLSNGVVAVSRDRKVTTLLRSREVGLLFPRSSALTAREDKLYLGMRQFVGEVDLKTKRLRFLVPNRDFLNQLGKQEADAICRRAGR